MVRSTRPSLIGAVVFLVKRTLFSRVDELAKEVREIRDGTTKKGEYEKDQEKLVRDIEQIKKDYTPRSVHERASGCRTACCTCAAGY